MPGEANDRMQEARARTAEIRAEQLAKLTAEQDAGATHVYDSERPRAPEAPTPGLVEFITTNVREAAKPLTMESLKEYHEGVRRTPSPRAVLPTDAQARKDVPLATGVLDYFPAALAEVARVSKAGNDKHNPGEDLHWARGKSMDQADCALRHLMERGSIDPETGHRHSALAAWRVLALLQLELEAEGAPMARGAR